MTCVWLNQYPFDFIELNLIVPPVIEASGAGALMVRHLLCDFQLAAVPQVFSDAGRTESVTADFGFDAGVIGATADHSVYVGLAHGAVGQIS